jgi:tetratricopeptide (TPR) repeat protein
MRDSRLDSLRRRVELDPTSIAFAALAEEYRRSGNPDLAVKVCRSGLTRHPAYLSARVTLGRALLDLGDLEAAEAELRQVLEMAPGNLAAVRALSQIHEQLSSHGPSRAPSHAPDANVIPFRADPTSQEGGGASAHVLTPVFGRSECTPVLASLDRFLSAIVTLKRTAV